ncbi:SDR family NAD(P)-dependent oxidoreductase [Nostoc sp.]|uniref:SDR family NAD(P)-dependent oxidoreductase n=1 Tax=Nostoc sp. TaxID=1180 RepID=UPI002FF927DE
MINKIVLITGASSGIGKATAEKLLDDGYLPIYAIRDVVRCAVPTTHPSNIRNLITLTK